MKTNFKNIVAVSAVAFAGVFSANATENNAALVVSSENFNETVDYREEAQLITRWFADMAEAKATEKVMERGFVAPAEAFSSYTETENNFETADFRAEALLMTHETADREEAKATQRIMERGFIAPAETTGSTESEFEMTEYRMEAQLITKEIADREEAKATQAVMEKGWVENGVDRCEYN